MGNNHICCPNIKSCYKSTDVNVSSPDDLYNKIKAVLLIQKKWRKYIKKLKKIDHNNKNNLNCSNISKISSLRSFDSYKKSIVFKEYLSVIDKERDSKKYFKYISNDNYNISYINNNNNTYSNKNIYLNNNNKINNTTLNKQDSLNGSSNNLEEYINNLSFVKINKKKKQNNNNNNNNNNNFTNSNFKENPFKTSSNLNIQYVDKNNSKDQSEISNIIHSSSIFQSKSNIYPKSNNNFKEFDMKLFPGTICNPIKLKTKTPITISDRENTLDKYSIEEKDLNFFSKNKNKIKKYTIKYNDESSYYSGTFNSNWKRHGFGVLIILNKDVLSKCENNNNDNNVPFNSILDNEDDNQNGLSIKYIGFFKNNQFHGKGRLIDSLGNIFEGLFKNNLANGNGKLITQSGDIFIGNFLNDKPHGHGEIYYKDGSRYEGNLKASLKDGKGKFVYSDGSSYEGDFYNDQMHGKGLYKLGEGKFYSGDFFKGKMDGTGVFIWPDKKKYIGQYCKDKKHGYGIFIWPEGKRYEGEWKNGKQHGYGMYISNHIKKYGCWDNGLKQSWVDENKCMEIIRKIQKLKLNDIQSISNFSKSSKMSV